jgi:AcrR family transcriptional regulator
MQARAEGAAATRQRIVDATTELYREIGIPATTLKAVAQRADVSRGTILHHFGSADGLIGAVVDIILDGLELPDPAALERIDDRDARVRAFVGAMIDFQDRTSHWWTVFEKELQRPEIQQREARYWGMVANLQAVTLGPGLRDDPAANAALLSVIHPATVGTFLWAFDQAGLLRSEAKRLVIDLAVDAVGRVAARDREEGGLQ